MEELKRAPSFKHALEHVVAGGQRADLSDAAQKRRDLYRKLASSGASDFAFAWMPPIETFLCSTREKEAAERMQVEDIAALRVKVLEELEAMPVAVVCARVTRMTRSGLLMELCSVEQSESHFSYANAAHEAAKSLPSFLDTAEPAGDGEGREGKALGTGGDEALRASGGSALVARAMDLFRSVPLLNIQAFCHCSELLSSDEETEGMSGRQRDAYEEKQMERFEVGDVLKAVVIRVDRRREEVRLSICRSAFEHVLERNKHNVIHRLDLAVAIPDLGKIHRSELAQEAQSTFVELLERDSSFENPSALSMMMEHFGMDHTCCTGLSLMRSSELTLLMPSHKSIRQRQNREYADAVVTEGVSLAKKGDNAGALERYVHALSVDKQNVNAYVGRGALYANGGEYGKAIRVFEAALELDPTHENARSYLERCKEKERERLENERQAVEARRREKLERRRDAGNKGAHPDRLYELLLEEERKRKREKKERKKKERHRKKDREKDKHGSRKRSREGGDSIDSKRRCV